MKWKSTTKTILSFYLSCTIQMMYNLGKILTKCIMFHYLTIRLQYIWRTMTLPLTIRLLWFYNLHYKMSIKSGLYLSYLVI